MKKKPTASTVVAVLAFVVLSPVACSEEEKDCCGHSDNGCQMVERSSECRCGKCVDVGSSDPCE